MIAQVKMRMDFAEHDIIAGGGENARDVRVAGAQALSLGKENGTSHLSADKYDVPSVVGQERSADRIFLRRAAPGRAVPGVSRVLKASGMNWTVVLELEAENKRALLAAEILSSDVYSSSMDKVRAFVQQGEGCRATLYNYRRRLNGEPSGKTAWSG